MVSFSSNLLSSNLKPKLGFEVRFSNVMFKTRAAVFYRDLNRRGAARLEKTLAASFLNGFKNIPGKACVKRVHDAVVNVGNKHTKKTLNTAY